jgi:hypothetical protein
MKMSEGNGDPASVAREEGAAAVQPVPSGPGSIKQSVLNLPHGSVEEKEDIATTAVQTLGPGDVEAKKAVATAALQTLGTNAVGAKKEIAVAAMQTLPAEAQEELFAQLQGPSRKVSDRIWMMIVASFAIVFVGGTAALVAAVFLLQAEQIQVLLTVFTTVAGILAGFISGRASSSGRSGTTT